MEHHITRKVQVVQNELLTNFDSSVVGNTASLATYYLNLTPVRNIYMKSPNLTSFNTVGRNSEFSIIRKYL